MTETALPHLGGRAAVVAAAPAKVNLYLRVTGRRDDGYHLLDSLVVFAGAADAVRATPHERLTLDIDGSEAGALVGEADNLVLRAARALAANTNRAACAALRLEKHLPVAAGLGGGSADAAATLRALNALWKTGLAADSLRRVGATLGADVPVCVESRPVRMLGVGDVLREVPALPPFGLLLANPRVGLATASVFAARQGAFSSAPDIPACFDTAGDLAAWLRPLGNDLEAAAISLCPPVAEVLAGIAAQPGCLLARMSGSGATCFGLFDSAQAAARGAAGLPAQWWRWGGAIAPAKRSVAPAPA